MLPYLVPAQAGESQSTCSSEWARWEARGSCWPWRWNSVIRQLGYLAWPSALLCCVGRYGELYSYSEQAVHRASETFGPDSTMPQFFLPHPLTEDVSCCNLLCFNLSRHQRSDLENSATPFASPWRPPDAKTRALLNRDQLPSSLSHYFKQQPQKSIGIRAILWLCYSPSPYLDFRKPHASR